MVLMEWGEWALSLDVALGMMAFPRTLAVAGPPGSADCLAVMRGLVCGMTLRAVSLMDVMVSAWALAGAGSPGRRKRREADSR